MPYRHRLPTRGAAATQNLQHYGKYQQTTQTQNKRHLHLPPEASLLKIVTAKAMDLSDEWEGINGKAYISPEKLQQTTEILKAALSQPKNPAA